MGKLPKAEEMIHSDHNAESLVNNASEIVEPPIESEEAQITVNTEAKAVESVASLAAPESEIEGPGAPTDVVLNSTPDDAHSASLLPSPSSDMHPSLSRQSSKVDLTSIPARADSPQHGHASPLFGSKLYRTTSVPVTPIAQPQPPLIVYRLTETLPWSVKHVDAALTCRFGIHKYRIYEAPVRGGFREYRPDYLIQLHPNLAISTALSDTFQLEIVGEGSGPDGKGYFGEMSRIHATKICEFCHKTHEESRCRFVQLVTDTSDHSHQGSLTIADVVERIVKAKKVLIKVELGESPEVHERPSLTFEDSMVLDSDARLEEKLPKEHSESDAVEGSPPPPEDAVMPANASDPISQGWSSSPTLHTSDYTNVESIENEQLDSSLSVDAETGVAGMRDPVVAGSENEVVTDMPVGMEDACVIEGTGDEASNWKEGMSLLD